MYISINNNVIVMKSMPKHIKEKIVYLRKMYAKPITIMRHNDKYYVYEATSLWDKDKKKVKSILKYLGKINPEGVFVPTKKKISIVDYFVRSLPKHIREAFEHAKQQYGNIAISKIESDRFYISDAFGDKETSIGFIKNDGTFTPSRKKEYGIIKFRSKITETEKKIITCLSMNSRISNSRISKIVGISSKMVYYKRKQLTKKFEITYPLELNLSKLGYTPYIIMAKFNGTQPNLMELKTELIRLPTIQFAALLKGEYDLIIYLVGEDPVTTDWEFLNFRANKIFDGIKVAWYMIPFGERYSFMPLRQDFFEKVLSKKEWRKDKEHRTPALGDILTREIILLKELNSNRSANFSHIDKKYGLSNGTSRYTYFQLKNKGIIKRPTINLNFPNITGGIILRETTDAATILKKISAIRKDIMEYDESELVNKYLLTGTITSPEGLIYFLPKNNEEELEIARAALEATSKGGGIFKSLLITETLVGSLCYRRFDNDYSREYDLLVASKDIQPRIRIKYE